MKYGLLHISSRFRLEAEMAVAKRREAGHRGAEEARSRADERSEEVWLSG